MKLRLRILVTPGLEVPDLNAEDIPQCRRRNGVGAARRDVEDAQHMRITGDRGGCRLLWVDRRGRNFERTRIGLRDRLRRASELDRIRFCCERRWKPEQPLRGRSATRRFRRVENKDRRFGCLALLRNCDLPSGGHTLRLDRLRRHRSQCGDCHCHGYQGATSHGRRLRSLPGFRQCSCCLRS
jgi:hypothetical protein